MPAPLVIFSTFVGFVGGRWVGAVLMTLGMFIPATSFPILGHKVSARQACTLLHTVTLATTQGPGLKLQAATSMVFDRLATYLVRAMALADTPAVGG
jgi:hypothetical protein